MSKRRSHSSLDRLPRDIKQAVWLMIVDREWPADYPRSQGFGFKGESSEMTGDPTYEHIVSYLKHKGYAISRSAVGRYADRLKVASRMKQAGMIIRDVMADSEPEQVFETQKAVSQMITSVGIEFVSSKENFDADEIRDVAKAMKDCAAISIANDKHLREVIKAKAETAVKNVSEIAKKKNIDPETLRIIREEIYGITS